ncbi:MAG: tRNA guanosine(34) transglycosylase Tgt [Verrucomicrobia bacterium]|nr:MAG: tRNA guanosine(34) transglycosylase Tgt [Verrucomicrobiota bacterium]PYJ31977.1 MAG: tRNA guanosine(34) transglycosylase Tgt [Verrucomicrobiota bacterium]
MQKSLEVLASDRDSKARRGRLTTARGIIDTPAFMPVGTQGSVKGVSPRELRELDAQIILGNTYHLFVRPGLDVIKHFGGLHKFMNWDGPILTDSGGYQIFSLAKLRKITEDGVEFQNHIDGERALISPEVAMEIQAALGSDIVMALDECVPYPCEYDYAAQSAEMTTRWAKRCKEANAVILSEVEGSRGTTSKLSQRDSSTALRSARNDGGTRQLLFGIVQGSTFADLRKQSAQAIVELDFDGYAIGGVSVGEPEKEMMRAVESAEPFLPRDKPRYAMGLGTPPQLLEMIARGMDMFDCVLPTRLARNGTAFTDTGTLNLKNAEFALDKRPIEENCTCNACREFSRGYIRHLIKAEEILGLRLITLHNLHFYLNLMNRARIEIEGETFDQFRKAFVADYKTREAMTVE